MRASSISHPGVAASRELPSNFDVIQKVAEVAGEIEELAPYAEQIATLVAALPDVTTVQEAADIINNLSVTVETLPEGSTATAVLTGTNVHFGIPRGADGSDGIDGVNNYVHIKYAVDKLGSGISDSSAGRKYIGTFVSNNVVASSNPSDYEWSLFVGADGADGKDGADGVNGLAGSHGKDGQSPIIEFYLNGTELVYETVGYEEAQL
jgi:hypothetical protein